MKSLAITFSNGEKYYAKLLEKEAPQTTKAFIKSLPLDVKVKHARFAGQVIFFLVDDQKEIPLENPHTDKEIKPGMLSLYLGSPSHPMQAVHLWYGDHIDEKQQENIFALIEEDLSDFNQIGEKIWDEGPMRAKIELVRDSE